jgi:hypothetical protein
MDMNAIKRNGVVSLLRRVSLAVLVFALLVLAFPRVAAAQATGTGSGLIISPTRSELVIDPGKTDKITLTLRNVSGNDVTARVLVNDFESDNETGNPRILADPNTPPLPTSIRGFLLGATNVRMKKDEKKDVVVTLRLPANTSPGAYYGVIRYSAIPDGTNDDDQSKVSLTASVGTLVLIEVPGDIKEQIQINSVKVLQDDKGKAKSFFFKKPTRVAIDIKNNGNGFARPFGKVSLYDWNDKEVFSYELNKSEPRANILPVSKRVFKDELKKVDRPGRYKIIANVSYGNGNEVIPYTVSFWYIPTLLLIIAGVVLLLLIVGLYTLYRVKFRAPRRKRR